MSHLAREHHGPRAVINALERLATAYPTHIPFAREDLAVAEGQLTAYRKRLDVPFQHTGYLTELTRLRDQLKAGLAGVPPEERVE